MAITVELEDHRHEPEFFGSETQKTNFTHIYLPYLSDSGATVTCIGSDAATAFNNHPQKLNCSGYIWTANNSECYRTNRHEDQVSWTDEPNRVLHHLYLKQDVYLGTDYWMNFGVVDKITDD